MNPIFTMNLRLLNNQVSIISPLWLSFRKLNHKGNHKGTQREESDFLYFQYSFFPFHLSWSVTDIKYKSDPGTPVLQVIKTDVYSDFTKKE
jgi:hypothetical protein